MRLSLIDLIVLGGLFLAGAAVSTPALLFARPLAVAPFGVACGLAAVLMAASPIYRRLYFRPLFVPVCPHCHRRPQFYRLRVSEWPVEIAACGSCGAVTVFWYLSCPPPEEQECPAPVVQPGWPYFLGNWRVVRGSRGGEVQDAEPV